MFWEDVPRTDLAVVVYVVDGSRAKYGSVRGGVGWSGWDDY